VEAGTLKKSRKMTACTDSGRRSQVRVIRGCAFSVDESWPAFLLKIQSPRLFKESVDCVVDVVDNGISLDDGLESFSPVDQSCK